MKITIYPSEGQKFRTGTVNSLEFRGLDCVGGWFIVTSSPGITPARTFWITGTFGSLIYYATDPVDFDGRALFEVDANEIALTSAEKKDLLRMVWEWEVWEPILLEGTCAVESLERMLELPRETLLSWFVETGRNPSVLEDIVTTLQENGYRVELAGPEGFGKFRHYRRMVSMFLKRDPTQGHVVVVYEDDSDIFDAAGVFKRVEDIVWSDTLGYNRGSVVKIEKE
jgi:hypothetical protein